MWGPKSIGRHQQAKMSFNKLPEEVRKRIYGYVLFDHDGGLIFVPRATTRKMMPQVEGDFSESEEADEGEEGEEDEESSKSWKSNGYESDEGEDDSGYGTESPESAVYLTDLRSQEADNEDSEVEDDAESYEDNQENEEEGDGDDEGIEKRVTVTPPRQKPALLLVNKKIRSQALPIYYSTNAFSWYFDPTKYRYSTTRFSRWIDNIGGANAKLIRGISIEGEHLVEEEIGISFDVDLLLKQPFFKVNVDCYDIDDSSVLAIKKGTGTHLNKAFRTWLEKSRQTFTLSQSRLRSLGELFVRITECDPGEADGDEIGLTLEELR